MLGVGLLNHLRIKKAAIVGWSGGAIIGSCICDPSIFASTSNHHPGLNMASEYPDRVERLFAYAANYYYQQA
jgi:hypothetical protein